MTVRVADYIADYLHRLGVRAVFLLSGGGMMHLIDAVGRVSGIRYFCNHHEQASAMAAEGYARQTLSLGVCYATSGPGATNLLTGLVGAWQDSAPVLFLTGQSKQAQTIQGSGIPGLRQFGTFEVDIVPIVRSVTKYAVFLNDPARTRFHLEKAVALALGGRPGPVLLDIPLDVQAAPIDPASQEGYLNQDAPPDDFAAIDGRRLLDRLRGAQRPLLLCGHGIRTSGAAGRFRQLLRRFQIPVVTTQLAKDLLPFDHPLFIGHPGVKGDRAGNFAVQNADLILALGCSLHTQTVGYEVDQFAVGAHKIQVDIDEAILRREEVGVAEKIHCGVPAFLDTLATLEEDAWRESANTALANWRRRCADWKVRFAVIAEPHRIDEGLVNFYEFASVLGDLLCGDETIVTDAGSAFYVMGQAFRLKKDQRYIVSGALGAMGYALPASIGVCVAEPGRTAICVTGDGSLQTNIQELQTLAHHSLNIKLFVINNDGYISIRNTQNSFFDGYHVGSSPESGVTMPLLDRLAGAYGLPYLCCHRRGELQSILRRALDIPGPVVCEVMGQTDQQIIPTVSSVRQPNGKMKSRPLHDMFPFLRESQERARDSI